MMAQGFDHFVQVAEAMLLSGSADIVKLKIEVTRAMITLDINALSIILTV